MSQFRIKLLISAFILLVWGITAFGGGVKLYLETADLSNKEFVTGTVIANKETESTKRVKTNNVGRNRYTTVNYTIYYPVFEYTYEGDVYTCIADIYSEVAHQAGLTTELMITDKDLSTVKPTPTEPPELFMILGLGLLVVCGVFVHKWLRGDES